MNSDVLKIERLQAVATIIAGDMGISRKVDRQRLTAVMIETFGCSDAAGAWSLRDGYDACELALTQTMISRALFGGLCWTRDACLQQLASAQAMAELLPTQSNRTEDQIAYQQFSTPVEVALTAAIGVRAQAGTRILEPSAGTGMLAAAADLFSDQIALHLNELEPQRYGMLQRLFPEAETASMDGARINQRWQGLDAAILNPPFARSANVGEDRHAAARHLVAALRALRPGGRAVAIMPEWFRPDGACAPGYAAVAREGCIVLDLLLPQDVYRRHGTSVEVRLMVVERRAGERATPARATMEEAIDRLLELPLVQAMEAQSISPFSRSVAHGPRPASAAARTQYRPESKQRDLAAAELDITILDAPRPAGEAVGLYVPWRAARHRIQGAITHPTPLVESMAMAAVAPPPARYRPMLPPRAIAALSDAQLETLILAGDAFSRDLAGRWVTSASDAGLEPSGNGAVYGQGFFLGDGTGAGKGRQVAGVLLDQWLRGRRRHLWVSKSAALLEDARRDWQALGGIGLDIQPLDQWPLGTPIGMSEGILFATYATLRSERPEKGSRLDQIHAWLNAGKDAFDGVIVFDEAHAMANALGEGGPRGRQGGSEQGLAGLRLQNRNPRAKLLYVSATGATDVRNLAYATRLGLWGEGTAFETREIFIEKIRASGLAAMELVARDLKAQGLYTARALSFAGVEYDILEHRLSSGQIETYDRYAEAWQIIHQNLDAALRINGTVDEISGETLNAQAKSAALSRFESTKQRFFAQVLMTMKLPSLINAIEADLAQGHAAVVQLVSTAEAMLDRRLAEFDMANDGELDLDLSPREYLLDYLANAFPIRAMEPYTDEDGKKRSRLMVNEFGAPVFCQQLIAMREAMVEQLCALPAVSTALDEIIRHFGADEVAEVTGRSRRLITTRDGSQKVERRSTRANLAETEAFMADRKRILLFSDAGGTGRSYHADKSAVNRRRRIHYLLEPGWRADNAIQGLGRTHRTHQEQPPLFRPVTTNVKGEKRFISTIARRLDSLGALTRGQRQTGGQNLFDPADNLESEIATSALNQWFRLVFQGKLQSITLERFCALSGLRLVANDGSGALREDLPRIQQWLNRILAFPIALQNAVFDEYLALLEARVHALEAAGRLDVGVETITVSGMTLLADRIVRTDPTSGATTHLLRLEIEQPRQVMTFERLIKEWAHRPGFRTLRNERSERVAALVPTTDLMADDGTPIAMARLLRPSQSERVSRSLMDETFWVDVDMEPFERLWTEEIEALAGEPERRQINILTGLLLPIWNRIPGDFIRVLRISDGQGVGHLGRTVDEADMAELARNMGLEDEGFTLTAAEVVEALERGTRKLPMPGHPDQWLQQSLVNGSRRIELVGFEPHAVARYKAAGCFTEIIRYKTRLFVPDVTVLSRLMNEQQPRLAA
jgi:predicted RNA methylase